MRVSRYFKLGKDQPFLDFVDVRLDTDVAVFVDPAALKSLKSPWGQECCALLQSYFEVVLRHIRKGNHDVARSLLSCLSERNEFHLGYSRGKSRGHAFGIESAKSVWAALAKSKASASGLLKDLEDTALLLPGIGPDMLSDAACNILRGPLIKYTQDMCTYYGIPVTPELPSGPLWDIREERWGNTFVPLPVTKEGKVIFVPKVIVRHRLNYRFDQYYTHFLLPVMQQDEIKAHTSLVHLLKDGTPWVTKKSLREKYGEGKLAVVDQTLRRPQIFQRYKETIADSPSAPLNHEQLAEIEKTKAPDWDELLQRLALIPPGKDAATDYENVVEEILSALFYPSLCNPTKQHRLHNGRKRVDITYTNEARKGFFAWVSLHYPSAMVFVECKNYGKEVGNPEIDQLSSRFSPSRGKFGILVCRSLKDRSSVEQTCRDTADDGRGYVVALTDTSLATLIEEARAAPRDSEYALLRTKFNKLIA